MHIAGLQQIAPDGLARAALEEHIVRYDDCRAPTGLEQRIDMLHKVQLLVACRGPEIVPADRPRLTLVGTIAAILFTVTGTQAQAALAPKWRIGQHHVKIFAWFGAQTINYVNRRLWRVLIPDPVQKHIHDTQPRGAIDNLPALKRLDFQKFALFASHLIVMRNII